MNKPAFTLLLFLLTILLLTRIYYSEQNRSNYVNGQEISLATTITSAPKISGNVQKITIFTQNREPIFVTLPRFPEAEYGQQVKISGTLEKKVLDNKKIVMTMYFPQFEAVRSTSFLGVQTLRKRIANQFHSVLPSDLASLLVGITVGIKEDMSPGFKEALQKAGVMHVVVASGMNVVLLGGFLACVFSFFFKRQVALLLTLAGIAFYALLAGLEPPIIRASIMGSLVFISQILGRQYFGAYGLFLAAVCMLFVDPTLLHDVGFQLSVLATAGLIFIGPVLGRLGWLGIFGDDLKTTLSAQLATLPILLVNFGSYSPFSIVVNMLVLWTTPVLMVLGGIAAVFSFIFEPLSRVILYLALPFLIYFEKVVYLTSHLTSFEISEISPLSIIGYYVFLSSIVLFRRK